jgi:DNA-directed RNA polymerase subunit D
MNASITKQTSNYLEVTIIGASNALVNTLRRIVLSDVETLAIDTIQVIKNTTVLPDEFINHRLALIPILYDLNKIPESATFEFNQTAGSDGTVWDSTLINCVDPTVQITKHVPIVKVNTGQTLHLVAKAKRGTGFMHSKWCPVSKCYYKINPTNTIFIIETIGDINPVALYNKALDIVNELTVLLEKMG